MDIFGLGWKFLQNTDKIDRVSELVRPMGDKAAATPDAVPKVREAYEKVVEAHALVKPIIDEFNKVSVELVPLLTELYQIFAPTAAPPKPGAPATAKQAAERMNYNVKWIQDTLEKDLGKKTLPKFGKDGTYGEETRKAVEKFQQKHPECGEVDGWVGPKTAAVMEALNPPWEKTA